MAEEKQKTIAVVGLGLMGGSMAKAIKTRTDYKVLGLDINEETMQLAFLSGAIDEKLTKDNIKDVDLLMIAIMPHALIDWIVEHAPYFNKKMILVDLCGVKRIVYDAVSPVARKYGFLYVGGHPMAGKEVAGFTNARADLYEGASMLLCPDDTCDIIHLDWLKQFYLSLGFRQVVFTNPEEHDSIISFTSQLAHAVSSAYIKSPTSRKRMGFTAGSYKDMTRVARLNPNMWTELFMADADHLTRELDVIIQALQEYRDAIASGDEEELHRLLAEGNELKITEPYEDHKAI